LALFRALLYKNNIIDTDFLHAKIGNYLYSWVRYGYFEQTRVWGELQEFCMSEVVKYISIIHFH
jgi:hypothetical protein